MTKRRKLSHEILGLLGASFAISVFLFEFLSLTATSIAESYCDRNNLILTFAQQSGMEAWISAVSMITCVLFFIILFLFLLGQKLSYLKKLTDGVDALRTYRMDFTVPVEGNNELTELAETINYLSATEQEIRLKEQALTDEKEQFIRTLSHDIRTPLTSIISYSELLLNEEFCMQNEHVHTPENADNAKADTRKEHIALIQRKASQIKSLTDLMLEGSRREPEHFEDIRLLMEQLIAEAEEILEEKFELQIHLDDCGKISGSFDVQELRRIFDNLTSNILKYADVNRPVIFKISTAAAGIGSAYDNGTFDDSPTLIIYQENFKSSAASEADSYRIGISSIRRILHNYGGRVSIDETDDKFAITIAFLKI